MSALLTKTAIAARFAAVTKYYMPTPSLALWRGRSTQPILGVRDVTLEIPSGEVFGLVGRNGQGKTTLVKCLAGLIEPTEGTVELFGRQGRAAMEDARRLIGLVSSDERSFYWRLTGWQNLLFFSRLHGMPDELAYQRIEPLLERFDLQALAQRRFDGYSAGNKQRLAIVRALLNDPHLLILDEPTRSLDPIAADSLRQMVLDWKRERSDRTAIITSHNLAEIESMCDRIGILSRNALAQCDTLENLRLRYPAHDRVSVRVRVEAPRSEWKTLREQVATLEWTVQGDGQWQLKFVNRRGEIHRVLAELARLGDEILWCNTERVGLREILEQVDGSEPK